MGAVQKLATVVMIGLVAMATAVLIYVANEPNRRGSEVTRQEDLAIERGTQLYITYCLQCHAPGGEGALEGTGRIGGILNQSAYPGGTDALDIVYQSDDPSMQVKAEHFIRYRIANGAPGDPRLPVVMPAFAADLNVEQVNDLVYLIMHGNWDYVYNEAMLSTGGHEKETVCLKDPSAEICGEVEPAVYPTVPPPAPSAAGDDMAATPAASPAAGTAADASGAAPVLELDAQDVSWSQKDISVKPGDTITVKNVGALEHDFSIDELKIAVTIPSGESATVTIPADAAAKGYEFYCSIPGHKEAGMVGTLTVGS